MPSWWSFISCVAIITAVSGADNILKYVTEQRYLTEEWLRVMIMGPSGSGKSSLINFMINNGTEVAEEGKRDSLTYDVTGYNITDFHTILFDGPGITGDTRGYTTDEITNLTKSSIIEQKEYAISGVILMFSATADRLPYGNIINAVIQIFGDKVLEKLLIVFNRNDKIDFDERNEIIDHCVETLAPIYGEYQIKEFDIKQHILFIDTKGDFNMYSKTLYDGMATYFDGDGIDIIKQDKEIQAEIERYYQEELNDSNNYHTWTEKIPHTVNKTRKVTITVDVEEWYDCNCDWDCREFLFWDYDCDWECDRCKRIKKVPKQIDQPYVDIWYEDVTKTGLKYDEEFLRRKAAKTVSDIRKNKVFAAYRKRRKDKKEL